ncbi:glycine zipper 2TM domain-containing protein, partial [Turicimonas muris]
MVSVKHAALAASVAALLAGCQANGDIYRSDVYSAGQVNQAQQVQTVQIIAIQPARVAVNNSSDRGTNQLLGTVIGGILGGVIGHSIDS